VQPLLCHVSLGISDVSLGLPETFYFGLVLAPGLRWITAVYIRHAVIKIGVHS
jgi:hypothetical protein